MAKIPYEHKWQKGDRIGKGGQGLTYLASSIPNDGNSYALKLLKEQRVKDRRDRMFVEVSSLQILDYPRIPKYFDSNAVDHKNLAIDLYLVTEFIQGQTLQEFIDQKGVLELDKALFLILDLAKTVQYCHFKGFCHRDIKPDNIVLKDSKVDNPFLIDFGLSFNEEIVKDATPSWQHIGNRFLSLPELRIAEGNKRDRRSDITMLCGVFLFCLTGIYPTDLLDETQTKPHRRSRSKAILQKLDETIFTALNRFFDIGFNLGINDRWPSAEAMISALTDIQNIKPLQPMEKSDPLKRLEAFNKSISQRVDFHQLQSIKALFEKLHRTVSQVCESVISKMQDNKFSSIQGEYSMTLSKQMFMFGYGIGHPLYDTLKFFPLFTCFINGSELILEAKENGITIELLRHPLNEEVNWSFLEDKLTTYYINCITSKLE